MKYYHNTLFNVMMVCVVSIITFTQDSCAQVVVVIAHKSTSLAAIDNDKLLDIFTLNTKNWGDGGKITLLEVKGDSPVKSRFYSVLGTSFQEMQRLWLKKQFAGKGIPPTALGSEDEIIQKVASTPGAIGYVSVEKASKEVKILATFR